MSRLSPVERHARLEADGVALAARLRQAPDAAAVSALLADWPHGLRACWPILLAEAPALETGLVLGALADSGFPLRPLLTTRAVTDAQLRLCAAWAMTQIRHDGPAVGRARELVRLLQGRTPAGAAAPAPPPAWGADLLVDDAKRDALFAEAVPKGARAQARAGQGEKALVLLDLPNVTAPQLARLLATHQTHSRAASVLTRILDHPAADPALWAEAAGMLAAPAARRPGDTVRSLTPLTHAILHSRARHDPPTRVALWRHLLAAHTVHVAALTLAEDGGPDAPFALWGAWRGAPHQLWTLVDPGPLTMAKDRAARAALLAQIPAPVVEAMLGDPAPERRQQAVLALGALGCQPLALDRARTTPAWPAIAAQAVDDWAQITAEHQRHNGDSWRDGVTRYDHTALRLEDRRVIGEALTTVLQQSHSAAEALARLRVAQEAAPAPTGPVHGHARAAMWRQALAQLERRIDEALAVTLFEEDLVPRLLPGLVPGLPPRGVVPPASGTPPRGRAAYGAPCP